MSEVEVTHPRAGVVVVELHGEHDLATKHDLRSLLSDLVVTNELVVVDLSHAEFIDSSVLEGLVRTNLEARLAGSRFVLQVGTPPSVRTALEVSGLLGYLDCADSRDEALAERQPL